MSTESGRNTIGIAYVWIATLCMFSTVARAHVPYFEHVDYTPEEPFRVWRSIEQSIAVYAWLQKDGETSTDVDVYRFPLWKPARVYVECLVPVLDAYESFAPYFAVIGPGLPEPAVPLPVPVSPGEGAVIVINEAGQPRSSFFEPFGNKSYYEGPVFDFELSEPGWYRVVFWDPRRQGGDYVAVLGYKEIWGWIDILRALYYTPRIRRGEELHLE